MKSLHNYNILILAAGKGRRLKNIGKKLPKCLLKIYDKSLLEILVSNLKEEGAKKITFVLGFKKELIIKNLKKIEDIKYEIIYAKNFSRNGHGMSWFTFKKKWFKEKKPLLLLHGDILFDRRFLKNIINSKKKNLVGITTRNSYKNESLVVESDNKGLLKKIGFFKNIKYSKGEILGINKFSVITTKKIFKYMSKFLKGKNKKLSWEFVLDSFIIDTNEKIYTLSKQTYPWVNINTIKYFNLAKKIYKRINL